MSQQISLLLAFVIFSATLAVDLYTDIRRWKKNQPVSHTRGAILRLVGLIPVIYLLTWPSAPFVCFLYWFLFDGLYNTFRKFGWWFTGSDDKDDAKLDNFLQGLKVRQIKVIKVGGMVVSFAFYLVMKLLVM